LGEQLGLENFKEEIYSCDECEVCLQVCPTYLTTNNKLYTPLSRIKIAQNLLNKKPVSNEMVAAVFFCTQCESCETVCPRKIRISEVVGKARVELCKRNYAPLEPHKKIIESILKNQNSVNGKPEKRWEWLPETYKHKLNVDSSTLFFVGCLSAYLTKNVAVSSLEVLEKAEVDFRLLEDEGCCGAPLINFGDTDTAEKIFKKNLDKFDDLGIKKILVACAGCYRTFKKYYPEITGEKIEIYHLVELLSNLYKDGKLKLKKTDKIFTYHDPCHLGRAFNLYDEPRILLNAVGNLVEMDKTRENSFCCGANSGVRAAFKDFSVQIALQRIEEALKKADILTTPCPFCLFNLNYVAIKNNKPVKVKYLAEILLESLDKP